MSEDGLRAAVLLPETIAYIDLTTRTVLREYSVTAVPVNRRARVLLKNEWLYIPGALSIYIPSGFPNVTPGTGAYIFAKLRPGTDLIYAAGVLDAYPFRIETSQGIVTLIWSFGKYPNCAPVGFSRDGSRMYSNCGKVMSMASDYEHDMAYHTSMPVASAAIQLPGSADAPVAMLAEPQGEYTTYTVRLADPNTFRQIAVFPLQYTPALGSIFTNAAGSELYVVTEAPFGVQSLQTIKLTSTTSCPAAFEFTTATAPSAGAAQSVRILADFNCVYRAESQAAWIELVGGGLGSGPQSLRYIVRPNTTGAVRTGTIRLGTGQTISITQEAAGVSTAPYTLLGFEASKAEYNRSKDAMVFVSDSPAELFVYQTQARTVSAPVPLIRPATALAVRPDGEYAAVAHAGWISIVKLWPTAVVERVIKIESDPQDLVLAPNGYLYWTTWLYNDAYLMYRNPAGGGLLEPGLHVYPNVANIRLHPSGKALYSYGEQIVAGSTWALTRWNIENDLPTPRVADVFRPMCNRGWFFDNGDFFANCGNLFRTSESSTLDGVYSGTLPVDGWGDFSTARNALAIAPAGSTQTFVQVTNLANPAQNATIFPPPLPSSGSPARAERAYWSADGNRLMATASKYIADRSGPVIAVWDVPLGACTYSLTGSPFASSYQGGSGQLTVTTQAGCKWSAVSASTELTFASHAQITGSGTVGYTVLPNSRRTPFSHRVTIGGQPLLVPQDANPGTVSVPATVIVPAATLSGTVSVTTSNQSLAWHVMVVAGDWWLTVGGSFTGNASFSYQALPNTSGAPHRYAIVSVNGQLITFRQDGAQAIYPGPSTFTQVSAKGGPVSIAIGTAGGPTLNVANPAPDWLTVQQPANSTHVNLIAKPNYGPVPRSTYITVLDMLYPVVQAAQDPLVYYPIAPCRIADTRNPSGPSGGPTLDAQATRTFDVRASACGIPAAAESYALNVTVVPSGPLGYVTVYPAGQERPVVSLLNSLDGRIKANGTLVSAGTGGGVSVFATNRTDVILDINGYFAPASHKPGGLGFARIAPCRVLDTRLDIGKPALTAGVTRTLQVAGKCNLSPFASAYALNITVLPKTTLGYLTVSPTGQPRPLASTLNAVTGTITANMTFAVAGTNGAIDLFANADADVLVDVAGSFQPPVERGGELYFYPTPPCRVADTRTIGNRTPLDAGVARRFEVQPAVTGCDFPPQQAEAAVLNATVIPDGPFGYLTLFDLVMPLVSTLNAVDGALTSNGAIVPLNGSAFQAFGSSRAHAFFDTTGFFSWAQP